MDNLDKINLLQISDFELARWLRGNASLALNIKQAYYVNKMIKQAHQLGVTRGKALRE